MKDRKIKILELREKGLTLREIGERFGVSRQRIEQIINSPGRISSPCVVCNKKVEKGRNRACMECLERFFRTDWGYLEGTDFVREIVRIRDKHTCQECGKIWQKGERRFDVHHLNGMCGKKSRSYDCVTEIQGLITLCHKCHLNQEEVIQKMKDKSSPRPNK